MKLDKLVRTEKRIYVVMLFSVMAFLIFCLIQPLYADIDNYVISAIVNGLYGSDNYCYYLNPILCKGIMRLGILMPEADHLILIFRGLVFGGFCTLLYLICRADDSLQNKVKRILGLWILSVLAVAANFTVVAAYACMTGNILIGYFIKTRASKKYAVIGIFFFLMGIMVRAEAGELLVPFAVLNILMLVCSDKACRKSAVACGSAFALCALSVLFAGAYQTSSAAYQEYYEYNRYRSAILDYPTKDYKEVSDELEEAGITENDYLCLKGYIQFDTDAWPASRLKSMADKIAVKHAYEGKAFFSMFSDIVRMLIQNKALLLQTAGLTFLCILICKNRENHYKAGSFLVWAGSFVIILYYFYIGRCPARLYQAVLFGAWGCIWTWTEEDGGTRSERHGNFKKLVGFDMIALLVAAAVFMRENVYVFPQNIFDVKSIEQEYCGIEGECQNIYIWNVQEYNDYMRQCFADKGKLPTEEFLKHNYPAGGWRYGHRCYHDFMEQNQIGNLMRHFIEDEGVYLVGDTWTAEAVETHIQESGNRNGHVEKRSETEARMIWKWSAGRNWEMRQ